MLCSFLLVQLMHHTFIILISDFFSCLCRLWSSHMIDISNGDGRTRANLQYLGTKKVSLLYNYTSLPFVLFLRLLCHL